MENKTNSKAIISLVLGIVSCVTLFFGYGALIGVVLSIVGIILGVQAKKEIEMSGEGGKGMATAGIVCSIVSLALCVLSVLCIAICVGTLATMDPSVFQ